jgi:hypothetical protein
MPTSQPGFYRRITELARLSGFRREGPTGLYSIWREGNLGVIDLQRAKYSDRTMAAFAPKLGVSSALLAEPLGQPLEVRIVSFGAYHWSRWRGYIHREVDDEAWYDISDDPKTWKAAEKDFVEGLVPVLKDHLSHRGLLDCWLQYPDHNMTPTTQKAYAATLVAKIGPMEALDPLLQDVARAIAAGGHVAPGVPALLQPFGITVHATT